MLKAIIILVISLCAALHHNQPTQDIISNDIKNIQYAIKQVSNKYNQLSTQPSTTPPNLPPLPLKVGDKCKPLSSQQQNTLKDMLANQSSQLEKVKIKLKECSDCSGILQTQKQIQKIHNRIKSLQYNIANTCQPPKPLSPQQSLSLVNLRESIYKDNAKAENWSYGTLTPQQYTYYAFSAAAQFDLTSCPINKPFASQDRKQCLDCPNGEYFNMESRKCNSCNSQQVFNTKNKKCQIVKCKSNEFFNSSTKACQKCPETSPLYNNILKKCDKCSDPQVYDFNLNKCIKVDCLINELYNGKTSKCQTCPPSTPYLNPNTQICQECQINTVYNSKSFKCQPCTLPTPHWNKLLKKCEQCPKNSNYNEQRKRCEEEQCNKEQFPYYNNITKRCQGCQKGYYYDIKTKNCLLKNTSAKCDPKTPIYDPITLSCKPCPEKSTFNKQTDKCQFICPQGEKYNLSTSKCQPICKQPLQYSQGTCKTPQEIKGCSNPNQVFSKAKNTCIKISQTCRSTQYYSQANKKCQVIPICPSGHFFNKTSLNCQITNYITSPKSSNLIYNGKPFKQYQAYYNSFIKANPNYENCPPSYPYYSLTVKSCVSCPSTHPYFNLNSYNCQNCGKFQYDKDTKSCYSEKVQVGPTLERLIMNII